MPTHKAPKTAVKEKRTLVRWDADIDANLLLAVQAACNSTGTKIPWDAVAKIMGPKFSEGAIVQHLSKMRTRRVKEGKPVPPPLRRATGSGIRKGKSSAQRGGNIPDDTPEEDEDLEYSSGGSDPEYGAPTSRKSKRTASHRARGRGVSKHRTSFTRKSSSHSEKACADAPFLQFLPDGSDQSTDLSRGDPEVSSRESDLAQDDEYNEIAGPNECVSPKVANSQICNIASHEESESATGSSADGKQILRLSFKKATADVLPSDIVGDFDINEDQHTPNPMPPCILTPVSSNHQDMWGSGTLRNPGDGQLNGHVGVQEPTLASSQYMFPMAAYVNPLQHPVYPLPYHSAPQSMDWYNPGFSSYVPCPQGQGYPQVYYQQNQSVYPPMTPQAASPTQGTYRSGISMATPAPSSGFIDPQELLPKFGSIADEFNSYASMVEEKNDDDSWEESL